MSDTPNAVDNWSEDRSSFDGTTIDRRIRHMGLGLGIMPRVKGLLERCVPKSVRRGWQTRFRANGKVALGEPLNADGNPTAFPADWIFVDWKDADYVTDLVKNPELPFGDRSQKLIYSAHLIEHLPQPALEALLRECCRVLAPGGRIRIECPDAEKLASLYRRSDAHMLTTFRERRRRFIVEGYGADEKYLEDHLSLLGEISNYIIPGQDFHMPVYASRQEFDEKFNSLDLDEFAAWCFSLQTPEQRKSGGHQNILYFSKLKGLLEEAGFVDVVPADFEATSIPDLRLNQDDPRSIRTKSHRRFYSLYVEATKPPGRLAPGAAERPPARMTVA
jgi:SAM-dependent methyltransferase